MTDSNTGVLIVESSASAAEEIRSCLEQTGFAGSCAVSRSVAEALRQLNDAVPQLCLVGDCLPLAERCALIRALAATPDSRPSGAVIAVLSADDNEALTRIVRSGAQAIVFRPLDAKRLQQAINTAQEAIRRRALAGPQEERTSLPWILESVAKRLEQLAVQVREEEIRCGESIAATTEGVKEALLNVLLTSTSVSTDFDEGLVAKLKTAAQRRSES